MRKTFVVALVALMVVLALVSCDNIPVPGADKSDDGLVTVKVKIDEVGSNSRSLTLANAKEWNYIEVFMKETPDGSKYIHNAADVGELTLTIRTGTYLPADSLILLGNVSGPGGSKEYTLLATGRLKNDPANLAIDTDTETLTFEVTALKASLKAGDGDFVISTDFTTGPTGITGFVYDNGKWTTGNSRCFQVPINWEDIAASLTITGFTDTKASIIVTNSLVSFTKLTGADAITVKTNTTPANGAIGANNLTIGFTFDTTKEESSVSVPISSGTHRIIFEVSVFGFSATAADMLDGVVGTPWKIRGGTIQSNTDLDGTSKAGGVALRVVDPEELEEVTIGEDGFIIVGEMAP